MFTLINISHKSSRHTQRGVAAVEFAFVAVLFFVVLFGIFELARIFYVFNAVQEVTRHAAREAVVRWVDNSNTSTAKSLALYGQTSLLAGAEITVDNIDIKYLRPDGAEIAGGSLPPTPEDNISACLSTGTYDCIAFVSVSIIDATYAPMFGFFSGIQIPLLPFSDSPLLSVDLRIPIPASTVTMPAESMGYSG